MRSFLLLPVLAATALLSACATAGATPDGDVASYDSLRQMRERCTSEGKELTLRDGGNDRRLSGYECRGK